MDIQAVVVRINANGVTLRWIDSLWIQKDSAADRQRQLSGNIAAMGVSGNYFESTIRAFRLEDGCLAESKEQ